VPINPDFSALEAVITAKVESVATNIDNKDLLIQMKALEAAVANLALTRVISEGTYQQGQVLATASTASGTLSAAATAAGVTLQNALNTATTTFNTLSDTAITTINGLLDELGTVNASDIIALVNSSLTTITNAATAATGLVATARLDAIAAIQQLQSDATGVVSGAGTTALNNIAAAYGTVSADISSAEYSALTNISSAEAASVLVLQGFTGQAAIDAIRADLTLVRNDRWLGLGIFAPTV